MSERPKYVIINDCDAPQPQMVCQWVPGKRYCYLDRSKASFDGLRGLEATSMSAFGFEWTERPDGTVLFNQCQPSSATYSDGEPRAWQSSVTRFEHKQIKDGA